MTSSRAGRSSLGCLVALLLLVAACYFGLNVGEAYWRYYQFRDAMQQEVRFASARSDAQIVRGLQAKADSLGLPDEAGHIRVRRTRGGLVVWSSYTEHVELPLTARTIRFEPRAEVRF